MILFCCPATVLQAQAAEYHQADLDDPNCFVRDSKSNGDIPFDHATLTDTGAAAAMQVNTRAVLGKNTEACSYADMINTD